MSDVFCTVESEREKKKDEEEKMLAVLSLAFFHLPPPSVFHRSSHLRALEGWGHEREGKKERESGQGKEGNTPFSYFPATVLPAPGDDGLLQPREDVLGTII